MFKPKNPWTMSVLNCLAELHQEPDLKLTLKFEIEVLLKSLNIEIKVVSNILVNNILIYYLIFILSYRI